MLKGNGYSQEERLLAALAHGSVMANGMGIIGGLILYLTQKEKSRFVAYQGLQAAVYQFLGMMVVIGSWIVWTFFYVLSFIPMMDMPSGAEPPPLFWIGLGSMAIPLLITLAWLAYGVYGALRAFQGREFRYLLVGRLTNAVGLTPQESA